MDPIATSWQTRNHFNEIQDPDRAVKRHNQISQKLFKSAIWHWGLFLFYEETPIFLVPQPSTQGFVFLRCSLLALSLDRSLIFVMTLVFNHGPNIFQNSEISPVVKCGPLNNKSLQGKKKYPVPTQYLSPPLPLTLPGSTCPCQNHNLILPHKAAIYLAICHLFPSGFQKLQVKLMSLDCGLFRTWHPIKALHYTSCAIPECPFMTDFIKLNCCYLEHLNSLFSSMEEQIVIAADRTEKGGEFPSASHKLCLFLWGVVLTQVLSGCWQEGSAKHLPGLL